MEKLVAAVKAYALANYNQGWDIVVETQDDSDLVKKIGSATTEAQAIKNVAEWAVLWNEVAEDIRGA